MEIPAFVWSSQVEYDWLYDNLFHLAKKGIATMITRDAYQAMGGGDRSYSRVKLKPFTSHNEKLGINIDLKKGQPSIVIRKIVLGDPVPTLHPKDSAYQQALGEAIDLHKP